MFEVMRVMSSRVLRSSVTILGHSVVEGSLVLNSLSALCCDDKRLPNARQLNLQRCIFGQIQRVFPTARQSFTLTVVIMFFERISLPLSYPDLCVSVQSSICWSRSQTVVFG